MIVLIDTNILFDVLQQRAPHDAAAARLWKLVEERALVGFVSAISFNNIITSLENRWVPNERGTP